MAGGFCQKPRSLSATAQAAEAKEGYVRVHTCPTRLRVPRGTVLSAPRSSLPLLPTQNADIMNDSLPSPGRDIPFLSSTLSSPWLTHPTATLARCCLPHPTQFSTGSQPHSWYGVGIFPRFLVNCGSLYTTINHPGRPAT